MDIYKMVYDYEANSVSVVKLDETVINNMDIKEVLGYRVGKRSAIDYDKLSSEYDSPISCIKSNIDRVLDSRMIYTYHPDEKEFLKAIVLDYRYRIFCENETIKHYNSVLTKLEESLKSFT